MAKTIKIVDMTKETVIIYYGIQLLCFGNYGDPHKSHFRLFKDELQNMRRRDLGKVLTLAKKYEIKIINSRHIK